jgi:CubicO group peptidase (beta-lactamase class C family)
MKDVTKISDTLSKLAEKNKLTGLSIGQLDDTIIKYYNYGLSNVINKTHVTENTIFEFASLTKPIVSIIAIKVFQAFKIPLLTNISDIVPDYSAYPNVSLLNILSHSTGFPNWPSELHKAESHFTPGSRFSYSGFGYNLLENIFIELTGKSSEQLLQTLICKPLSLLNTSLVFQESKNSQTATGTKYGHSRRKWKPATPSIAGSLHSSVHDYTTIIQDIFSSNPVVFNEITQNQLFHEIHNVNCDFSNEAIWPEENFTLYDDVYWGLGWGIEKAGDSKYYWHWGDNEVFQSFFWIDPIEKEAIVLVTNCENGNKSWEEITQIILDKELKSITWLKTDNEFICGA